MAVSTFRNDMELGSVTNWPAVYAAAGVGAFLLVGLAAVGVIAMTQAAPAPPAPEEVAAIRPVPPPRQAGATPRAAPAPNVKPAEGAPLWKPLVPAPVPVSFPAVKPITVQAESISVPIPVPVQAPAPAVQEREVIYSDALQANVREIDIDAVEGTSLRLLVNADQRDGPHLSLARYEALKKAPAFPAEESALSLVAHRPDLAGLPLRGEPDCRASKEATKYLKELSLQVRRAQTRADRSARDKNGAASANEGKLTARDVNLIKALDERNEWKNDTYSPGLAQMLCAETVPVRLQLTKMLSATTGKNASVALARQALFDLSPQVRQAAIEALSARPRQEYRRTLTEGFRYPWPAVADRAAEALTAVEDRGAAADLTKLLDRPDPAAPLYNEKKRWVVAEVVKVNHLRNCLLCHAPAKDANDPVLGFVPTPGEAIPVAYYADRDGDFVRADVTYLRQDFSLMADVPGHGAWPARQRFDYLVRMRELTEQEIKDKGEPAKSYPQRDAVRRALDKLTTPDSGSSGLSRGK